jgi:hypothetical protein
MVSLDHHQIFGTLAVVAVMAAVLGALWLGGSLDLPTF